MILWKIMMRGDLMKPTARKKLKLKILGNYDSIKEFCEDIAYTQTGVSCILIGKSDGNPRFWDMAQKVLNIPDEEIELYKQKIS